MLSARLLRRPTIRHIARAAALALTLHARTLIAQGGAQASEATAADSPTRANGRVAGRGAPTSNAARVADEIRFAVLPLPEQLRDGATVMRMDSTHRPVVVRQGSNGMVCMRVVPGEAAWDARCYEATIARLIFRAGELAMSGLTIDSLGPRIQAEARAGTLTLPTQPVAAYRALGPERAYVAATGAVTAEMEIWQSLHVPFATAEAMGLPDESTISGTERDRVPYVVSSGTWWAHVMIGHQTARARSSTR